MWTWEEESKCKRGFFSCVYVKLMGAYGLSPAYASMFLYCNFEGEGVCVE